MENKSDISVKLEVKIEPKIEKIEEEEQQYAITNCSQRLSLDEKRLLFEEQEVRKRMTGFQYPPGQIDGELIVTHNQANQFAADAIRDPVQIDIPSSNCSDNNSNEEVDGVRQVGMSQNRMNLEVEGAENQRWPSERSKVVPAGKRGGSAASASGRFSLLIHDKQIRKKYGIFGKDEPDFVYGHASIHGELKASEASANNLNQFYYKVCWKKRPSGRIPIPNYFSYEELMQVAPRMLLSYFKQLGIKNKFTK